jgi:NAD(P)-dependent dehydrogenase (short-subunit alcohol dehydrogenase family)
MSTLSYQLEQRTGVVTGGSSGIGLETVRLMLGSGMRVAFCGRDEARLAAAERALRTEFPQADLLAARCDVLDAADTEQFAAAVAQRFGATDVLVNNAGQGRVSRFADTGDAEWREELDLKFFSVIRPLRAFMAMLEKSPCAAVVCVNSLLAAQPEPHMVATSAARAGVLNLSHSLGMELAPKKIRVNSLLLGLVESGQWRRRYRDQAKPGQSWEEWTAELARAKGIPLGRLGRPIEAAQAILFLASPLSSYTTGTTLDVSGGLDKHA